MEVAVIDWKSIDSRFVKDELYEHINAPKWVDFSASDDPVVDDEAWFCRPGCNHPKTVDDFFTGKQRTPISNSKLQRSASVSDIPPFGDKNKSDATLKKRGMNQPFALPNTDGKYHRIIEDAENRDRNFSTPINLKAKSGKEAIKSSTENKKKQTNDTPKLRSTLSARNLFSGGDLLNKVAEFCNELKKLATYKGRDKEISDNDHHQHHHVDENLGVLKDKEKEKKPLLELTKEKSEVNVTSVSKGKLRRKKRDDDDAENTPISVDVKNIIKRQEHGSLSQIRTSPPTPQCFSANRGTPLKSKSTLKPFKSRPPLNQERGILQEMKPTNKDVIRVEREDKNKANNNNGGGDVAEKEARSNLDVFWFLKPCTLST